MDSEIPNTNGIRNDVAAALRQINIPNLRWPGGCFADEYHWMDGISPMADLRRVNGREESWGVKYWGVGNENWGCGGNMTADFYADQFRRYATYCRSYGENRLFKIAGGANSEDFGWTETLMKKVPHGMMNG